MAFARVSTLSTSSGHLTALTSAFPLWLLPESLLSQHLLGIDGTDISALVVHVSLVVLSYQTAIFTVVHRSFGNTS